MILVLLVWLVAALGTTALGLGGYRLAARLGVGGAGRLPGWEWLSLAGWALLTAALQVWSLWRPVDGAAQLVFGLLTAGVLGLNRHAAARLLRREWRGAGWGAGAGLVLLLGWLLTFAAQLPTNYDVGLYQLQTLQWTERFAAVPGLGNLHGRLAFNSSLYLPMALFKVDTAAGPVYALSSYIYALLAVATVRAVRGARRSAAATRRAWALGLPALGLLYGFQTWLSSATPDTTTAALLLLLFYRCTLRPPGRASAAERRLLVLLAAWALTLKLSAAPVLLLALYAVGAGRSGANWRRWGWALGLGALLGLPWLARNVVLSGYLVYPLPALDWFGVDWKVPLAAARTEQHLIVNLARNSAQDIYAAPRQTLREWWPHWWRPQGYFPGVAIIAALASPLVAAGRWRGRRFRLGTERSWLIGWLVAWLGSAFWFWAAPDYRFGAGLLLVAALWPWLGPGWPRPLPAGRLRYLPAALLLLWVLQQLRDPIYQLRHEPARFARRVLRPELPPIPATDSVRVAPGLWVRVPRVGSQCWGAPVPCAPHAEPGLRLRGSTLAEGFRRE